VVHVTALSVRSHQHELSVKGRHREFQARPSSAYVAHTSAVVFVLFLEADVVTTSEETYVLCSLAAADMCHPSIKPSSEAIQAVIVTFVSFSSDVFSPTQVYPRRDRERALSGRIISACSALAIFALVVFCIICFARN